MLVNEPTPASQDDSAILHPSSRTIFRFWEQMRAERSAPRRTELDLTRIRTLVPDLLIAEREPRSGTFRWRLAGTNICELYRHEVTGGNMLAGWDSFETDIVSRFLNAVIQNQQPCLIRFRLRTDLDQVIGAEFIGLPLLAADNQTVHIFGGVFPFRDITSLGYGRIVAMELAGARSIWTEHLPGDQLLSQTATNAVHRPYRSFEVIPGGRN
ncbi:MAG: PAS domain-containing protein [Alphaproteobacteria bacterium]|nr:PAS domain-containing protein [Alphaproteobacteria bacterium]